MSISLRRTALALVLSLGLALPAVVSVDNVTGPDTALAKPKKKGKGSAKLACVLDTGEFVPHGYVWTDTLTGEKARCNDGNWEPVPKK